MRYYSLALTAPGETTPTLSWESFVDGVYNAKAQNIIFDIPVTSFGAPVGSSAVTIEGVSIDDLKKYNNFYNYSVEMYAGMWGGLPLSADQPPPSLIFKGWIASGFGNWIGNQISLTLFMTASKYEETNPGNFVLLWKSGQTLASALQQCFTVAYPGMPQSISISDSLVLPFDEYGIYYSLAGLTSAIKDMTQGHFLGATYQGVDISIQNGVITAWDGTQTVDVTELKYTDLIGQPAWVEADTLYVMTALRSDITVGNQIKLPKGIPNLPGFVTTVPSFQNSYQNYDLTFQGDFFVKELRHVGNFRSESGEEWATVIKCVGLQ